MPVQTYKSKSPSSLTICQLINLHTDLASYFTQNSQPQHYQDLALQLMREAIAVRSPKEKHYHVAYVKHNRFLSPSQKQAVSPKVTEVIPLSPEPVKIYGKPKVKLSDQFLNEEQYLQTPLSPSVSVPQSQMQEALPLKKVGCTGVTDENVKQSEIESQKYLSPRSSKQLQIQSRHKLVSPLKHPPVKQKTSEHPIASKQEQNNTKKQKTSNQNQEKRPLKESQNSKIEISSPKHVCAKGEKYDNVESRIKFLIDRDKKNKKLEIELEQQSKKINQLEQRQEKLLIRQYQQTKTLQNQRENGHQLGCCCSSDEEITNQLLKMRHKMNDRDYKSTLSKIKQRLEPKNKLYKISSDPIYPITSSSESDSSSEEVVIAGIY